MSDKDDKISGAELPLTLPVDAVPSSAGVLAEARVKLGLSLSDVSAETRIPKRHLAALESHQVERLPAKLFVIGYLRTCSELLDLDLNVLLAEYGVSETVVRDATGNSSEAKKVLAEDSASSVLSAGPGMAVRITIWRIAAIAILPLLCIIFLAWLYSTKTESAPQVASKQQAVIAPHNAQLDSLGQLASIAISDHSSATATVSAESMEDNIQAGQKAVSRDVVATIAQDSLLDHLVIAVNQDSWIHIADASGRELFRDLARAGKKIDVRGRLPFDLHLGNAPGLALELNGSPFAITDYRDDNSARLVLSRR